ncbi:MAG: hypothetical protein AB7S26_30390 [Sandaracinaceae bacterium]
MALLRTGWMTHRIDVDFAADDQYVDQEHVFQELELRIPMGVFVVEAIVGSSQTIAWDNVRGDNGVVVRATNPQVGVAYAERFDAWRLELGLACAASSGGAYYPDLASLSDGIGSIAFPEREGSSTLRAGWSPARYATTRIAFVPRARVELAPIDELVLGAEVDAAILVNPDDSAVVFPQGALEIAGQIPEIAQIGLRARATSWATLGGGAPEFPTDRDLHLNIALEPFARIMVPLDDLALFVRLAGVFPLGPTLQFYPPGGFFPYYLGGELEAGAIY